MPASAKSWSKARKTIAIENRWRRPLIREWGSREFAISARLADGSSGAGVRGDAERDDGGSGATDNSCGDAVRGARGRPGAGAGRPAADAGAAAEDRPRRRRRRPKANRACSGSPTSPNGGLFQIPLFGGTNNQPKPTPRPSTPTSARSLDKVSSYLSERADPGRELRPGRARTAAAPKARSISRSPARCASNTTRRA